MYAYSAVDRGGQRVAGVLAGASEQAVLAELEARRLVPIAVMPQAARKGLRRGVSAAKLGESYQQLADLLRAGVPLLRGLRLLGARRTSPRLAACWRDLAESVSQGRELAEGMEEHGEVFPPVHVAMVRAGERGGFLESVLSRLGGFVAAQAELRSKVIGSLIYPALLVAVGGVLLGVVLVFFVPLMKPLVAQAPSLPTVSRVVFGLSEVLRGAGVWVLAGVVVGGVTAVRALRMERWRRWAARAVIGLPLVGPVARDLATSRFCRLLGTLLGNGIPMLSAMEVARGAAGSPKLEEAIARAMDSVRAGHGLSGPLGESGLLAEDIVEMIGVGEAANNLDHVLVSIADTLDKRIDRRLSVAVRLIEPVMLLGIAAVVGVVAAGLLLPIMKMRSNL